jgi:hypothetical protein
MCRAGREPVRAAVMVRLILNDQHWEMFEGGFGRLLDGHLRVCEESR